MVDQLLIIAGEVGPSYVHAVPEPLLFPVFCGGGALHGPDAVAFPYDVQSHTLAHFALGVSIGQNSDVAVGMEVDESGTHHQPAGVDDFISIGGGDIADADDLPISNTDIRVKPGVAGAIH